MDRFETSKFTSQGSLYIGLISRAKSDSHFGVTNAERRMRNAGKTAMTSCKRNRYSCQTRKRIGGEVWGGLEAESSRGEEGGICYAEPHWTFSRENTKMPL